MKKWLIVGGCGLLVLMLALIVAARAVLTKNVLVGMIEESIDSRVEIGALEVSLFSFPAHVELKDVVIGERDAYANDEVAHDDRPKLGGGVVRVDSVICDVTLGDLLARRIRVEEFDLKGLHAKAVIYEDGSNSLDALFDEPPKTKKRKDRERKEKGFNAKDHEEFVTELKRVRVADCGFEVVVEKTGLIIVGEGVGFDIEDIRVDPNALEQINEARISMKGRLFVFSNDVERVKFGELGYSGSARARLFHPVSGEFEPDMDLNLQITEDSYVSTEVPYVEKVWAVTEKLDKLGLAKMRLPERVGFGRGRELKASYRKGRVDLLAPVSLEIEGWNLGVGAGSWFQTGDETHEFRGELVASEKVGDWVKGRLDSFVKLAPKELRRGLKEELIESLWVNNRLTLQVGTHGLLSDPKVDFKNSLPDLKDVAKKAAKDLLKKKLFDFARDALGEDD